MTVGKRIFVPRPGVVTADIPDNWLIPVAVDIEEYECPPPLDGTDDTYEVSHIVKENNGRYLIRWVGYGQESDSWLPAQELGEGASALIEQWGQTKARIEKGLHERALARRGGYISTKGSQRRIT